MSKHFFNSSSLVLDSLQGLCAVNPQLRLDPQNKIVFVADHDKNKVSLICGGGSGHEPAHAGFVGAGMLTGAVCGHIFASPSASQVRRAIDLVESDKGTLIIVKNYTGDVLNFGLAKENYAALQPDKSNRVKFLIVGDDVAVGRTQGKIVGRRGLAGTVLVYKIAGALAHRGADLDEICSVASWVSENVATVGVGLEHTHVPGTAPLVSQLSLSEIEIGMGIHNESGYQRLSPIPPPPDLMTQLLELLTSTSDPERSFVPFKGNDDVVILINNLGGLSELELNAIVGEARKASEARGLRIIRLLSGTFMTSLNMPGFSLTILRLPSVQEPNAPNSSLVLSLLDDNPDVPGWKWSYKGIPPHLSAQFVSATNKTSSPTHFVHLQAADPLGFVSKIQRACNALIAAEPEITRMDTVSGDGDCGLTLKAGAEAVLAKITDGSIDGHDIVRSIIAMASAAEESMGGTSGALYSIFFSGLAQGLHQLTQGESTVTGIGWVNAGRIALDKLYSYTRARPPSRTLVDPLAAFVTHLTSEVDFQDAVKAAQHAAEATKDIEAKAGRSAYVEGSRLREMQVPDPGAWGVKVILENLVG
ncbi:dihydroxyacetone kinase [Amanita muscaria]